MSYIKVEVERTQRTTFCIQLPESVDIEKYIQALKAGSQKEISNVAEGLEYLEEEYIEEHGLEEYRNSFFDRENIVCSEKAIQEIPAERAENFLVYKVKDKPSQDQK